MTREEFLSANGDKPVTATCQNRQAAMEWALTFSTWDETTYAVVAGDGYFEVIPLGMYEPWRGRIMARYQAGKRVTA